MYKKIFISRPLIAALLLTTCQQLIVASSTVWIIKTAGAIAAKQQFMLWVILFFISLFIVYIPSSLAVYFKQIAIYESFGKYVHSFSKTMFNLPKIFSNKSFRERREGYLTNQGWLVISESIHFFMDWFSISLNVVLNLIVIGYIVDFKILLGYLISVPLIWFVLSKNKNNTRKLALEAQGRQSEMQQSLTLGWENILTGNIWNRSDWLSNFNRKLKITKKTGLSSLLNVELVSDASMLLSLVPVFAILCGYFWTNFDDYVKLAILVVTLPRQIQIVQYLSDVVQYASRFIAVRAKIDGLFENSTRVSNSVEYSGTVTWSDISASDGKNPISLNSETGLIELINKRKFGRITFRGRNGSGKSSLLFVLKDHLGEKAFLFPTSTRLVFKSTSELSLSQGETTIRALKEIKNFTPRPSVLLLDEWDANLDLKFQEEISGEIDNLAKELCVVEVRHRMA